MAQKLLKQERLEEEKDGKGGESDISPLSFDQAARTINGSRELPFFDAMEDGDSDLPRMGKMSGHRLGDCARDSDTLRLKTLGEIIDGGDPTNAKTLDLFIDNADQLMTPSFVREQLVR